MRDLVELVTAFVAGSKPKKWWVSVVVSPFDAEPPGYTTPETKHALRVSIDAYAKQATLTLDGESETITPAPKDDFDAMLARIEKKQKVRYRLDRAYVAGSPVQLKNAVRAWLENVREVERPSGTFESIVARRGVDEKTLARWIRALEGGKGYDAELDEPTTAKLLASPELLACAREFLTGLVEVPTLDSRKAFKRAARLMSLLVRAGDAQSLRAAEKFFARTKKIRDAACYAVPMMRARAE